MTVEIEPKIISILNELTDYFGEGAVANGTFSVLDRGIQPYNYAVLMPGEVGPASGGASRRVFIEWKYELTLFTRYTNDLETSANLSALVKACVLKLFSYPTLELADMRHSKIVESGGRVEQVFDAGGKGPFFYKKILNLCYVREYAITGGEYAV